ncbi:MAG: RDD family protein [Balneolaceae bacterium]|nr:RDD family protein [Balneolaceae bacterium]
MIKDPKQIVTPFAFSVHPDLLGQPLATPKRRILAILLDLFIAYLLADLGNIVLASAATFLIFWAVIRIRSKSTIKNLLRFTGAAISSIFIFALALGFLEAFDPTESETELNSDIKTVQDVDWNEFGNQMMSMDYSDPEKIEKQFDDLEKAMGFDEKESETVQVEYPEDFIAQLNEFETAYSENDSSQLAFLRVDLAQILAKPELHELETEIDKLDDRVDDLREKNVDLSEQIENPSMYIATKRTLKMMGLSLGWVGLYFITTIAFFKGQTLGKKLLKIRVVRLNNKPIGLFFAFERFGGYAAGLATGFIGFFQVYWDANRQAIHDKIAGTVVIDLRESKKEKTEHLRKEVLENENLLSQF